MKRSDRLKKLADETMEKIHGISRHIRNVEDNCLILGEKLIERGEIDLGHKLIANGFVHDASKFSGIEWDHMAPGQATAEEGAKLKLKLAVQHHRRINPHHVEYWGSIQQMPRLYIAEMVCDLKARSEEFGTSLRDYIDEDAIKKWEISKEDPIYQTIMEFVEMLCTPSFEKIK
jgi:hypothetical protein